MPAVDGRGTFDVRRFCAEMASRRGDFASHIYPGVGHGFLCGLAEDERPRVTRGGARSRSSPIGWAIRVSRRTGRMRRATTPPAEWVVVLTPAI